MSILLNIWPWVVAIPTIVGVVFGLRKLFKWVFPIKICAFCTVRFGRGHPNEIEATVTNKGNETLYIIRCTARGTYNWYFIARSYLHSLFIRKMLLKRVRFGGISYNMMREKCIKIEPGEPIDLGHKLGSRALSAVREPFLIVEAELSTGRVFRSKKVLVPEKWKNIGRPSVLEQNA